MAEILVEALVNSKEEKAALLKNLLMVCIVWGKAEQGLWG